MLLAQGLLNKRLLEAQEEGMRMNLKLSFHQYGLPGNPNLHYLPQKHVAAHIAAMR